VPVEANVALIFSPIIPALPIPVTITEPVAVFYDTSGVIKVEIHLWRLLLLGDCKTSILDY
jgi:hypothetical protein